MNVEPVISSIVTREKGFLSKNPFRAWGLHNKVDAKIKLLCDGRGYGLLSGRTIARIASPFFGLSEGFLVTL